MTEIIDIARHAYENGYTPIPLEPGAKRPVILNWQNIAAGHALDPDGEPLSPFALWKRARQDANMGIYCGEKVIIIDGDAKDDAGLGITGKQVMDYLWENQPELFRGAIRELTAGGGSHTTYRWTPVVVFPTLNTLGKTYCKFAHDQVPIIPEGTMVLIELLTRNAQSVCPPSIVNGREYTYCSEETHLNTPRSQLPTLPDLFQQANKAYVKARKDEEERKRAEAEAKRAQYKGKRTLSDDTIGTNDHDAVTDGLVEAYSRGVVKGERHFNALGLAQSLASPKFGLSDSEIRSGVEAYFHRCSRNANHGEIEGILRRARDRPDTDPPTPWKAITKARKRRENKPGEDKAAKITQTVPDTDPSITSTVEKKENAGCDTAAPADKITRGLT